MPEKSAPSFRSEAEPLKRRGRGCPWYLIAYYLIAYHLIAYYLIA